jgi:hypothetical protein
MSGGPATAAPAAATWTAGMQVTLVRLTTRPHLNGATATVKRYLQSRDQWSVVLPDGAVVSVPTTNMITRETLAQLQYMKYGYPLMHQPTFADYVVEKHGTDGRYFVASTDIPMGTHAQMHKVRIVMQQAESQVLHDAFLVFQDSVVPMLLHAPCPASVSVLLEDVACSPMSLFVGKFMMEGHCDDPMVQDLMAFDSYSDRYLQETLESLLIRDVMLFAYWSSRLDWRFSAGEVWRTMTFLISHAFMNDTETLTLGLFCKAQCPRERWNWYQQKNPAPITTTLGNIEDIAPWGVQSEVLPHQVPGDQCVFFSAPVRKGAPVTMDYGPEYKMSPEAQLRQFHKHALRKTIEAVMHHLDPRVMQALSRHMQT